jgi:flagellar biosynthesis GTPase FlhF
MRIKKYLVKSFDDALSSIKKELGDDAFIMSPRKSRKGGLELSREEWLEVTAAVEGTKPIRTGIGCLLFFCRKPRRFQNSGDEKTVPPKAVSRISDHDPLHRYGMKSTKEVAPAEQSV